MSIRTILKKLTQYTAVVLVAPAAAVCLFGRIPRLFQFFAQGCALVPGSPGNLMRSAFYHLTLEHCALDTVISFGTFFSRVNAQVERAVSIGPYCVIGSCRIGARTQIASRVSIVSGRHQHARGGDGKLEQAMKSDLIEVGPDCWIGEGCIIAAPVGTGSTIGAGSVVVKQIQAQSVAVGNPARVIRTLEEVETKGGAE